MSEQTAIETASGPREKSPREVTDEVRAFYERYRFPGTRPLEQDSLIFLRKFDRIANARRAETQSSGVPSLRVLDAGCGTGNTTLSLAAQYSDCAFTGVDLSSASIALAERWATERGLANARFLRHDLLVPLRDHAPYDVLLCFGSLHHTADMRAVLRNLRALLAEDGCMFLWLYGRHGRYRHSLNMRLLAMLRDAAPPDPGLEDPDLALARAFIDGVGDRMAARDLLGERSEDPLLQRFFEDPTWIADQFLHPNEQTVDMSDILALLRDAGLRLREWVGAPRIPDTLVRAPELRRRFALLDEEPRLVAMDLLLKMDRYFLVIEHAATAQEGG